MQLIRENPINICAKVEGEGEEAKNRVVVAMLILLFSLAPLLVARRIFCH